MATVDDRPLHRGEIEIIVAWTRSGLQLAGDDGKPWAERMLAKLRSRWRDAPPRPEDDTPRDYKIPKHQRAPIDPLRSERTERDRADFRGHGLAPGEPMPGDAKACEEHVEAITARQGAVNAAAIAGERMGAHVVIDADIVIAISPDASRLVLYDPDADSEEARWAAREAAARSAAALRAERKATPAEDADATPAAKPAKKARKRAPKHPGAK